MRTSLYSVLCIVIRLGAVMLAVSTITNVLAIAATLREGAALAEVIPAAALTVIVFVLALGLWLYPAPLARLCTARSAGQVFESPIGERDLLWIALAVLGTTYAVSGTVEFITYGANALSTSAQLDHEQQKIWFIRQGLPALMRAVAGIALALGARGLARVLAHVRGRADAVEHDDAPQ
jgi:hypothetical protein